MTSNERNVLYTTCFGHFLSHFNMLTFPAVVLPLSRQLGLPLSEVLALSFYMYLLFGLTGGAGECAAVRSDGATLGPGGRSVQRQEIDGRLLWRRRLVRPFCRFLD